ncbi:hypothetical protein BC781_101891 [Sediminitomix flava]|uniref:Uncharacterized protein n=1 Tax=Sediminitomix flava TaxID=379075 RepID=A0A315ZH97_SEDFL|nr:hypothetical protein BC781_101891 [Sediminitomix flava]
MIVDFIPFLRKNMSRLIFDLKKGYFAFDKAWKIFVKKTLNNKVHGN